MSCAIFLLFFLDANLANREEDITRFFHKVYYTIDHLKVTRVVRMGTCQSSSIQKRKVERLKSMNLFVLDNSLRETSVCQIRGHSLEDKDAILAALDDTGINDVIVASFCDMKAVDDVWLDGLRKNGKIQSRFYAFSEMWQDVVNGAPLTDLPTGLKRFVRFSVGTSTMPNTNFENICQNQRVWNPKCHP